VGISYHRLGLDKNGCQNWTSLTADLSRKLLDGFLKTSNVGNFEISKLYLVGERESQVEPVGMQTRDREYKRTREKLVTDHKEEHEFILQTLQDLQKIYGYLRDDRKRLKSHSAFEKCVHEYTYRLVKKKGGTVSQHWYLHCLAAHIPQQLSRMGGSTNTMNCESQERMNGQHTKILLNVTQIHKSSEQILLRALDRVYFDYLFPHKKPKSRTYPASRKRARVQKQAWGRVVTMDEGLLLPAPKKKKNFVFNST